MKTGTVVVTDLNTRQTVIRLPGACEREDGSIWASNNQNPLVMISHLENADELKVKYAAAMKQRKPELISNEHLARIGVYGDREVIWESDRKPPEPTQAQRERNEITKLFMKAEAIANSDSEDNVSLPMQLRSKARAQLEAWRAKYPQEANKEKANDLQAEAAHKRTLASGALTYDADGWLNSAKQRESHDEFIAEAEALDEEAARLVTARGSE